MLYKYFYIFLFTFAIFIGTLEADSWEKILKSENASNSLNEVNAQCANDTRTWLQSLKLVAEVSVDCLISRKCNKKEIQIIKDNFYAIEQLDAFGKLPSSGIFEVPLIFDGSYQECQRISGKKYETNYCYLVLVPGRNSSCSIGGGGGFLPSAAFFRSATCMSVSCTSEDLPQLFNQLPLMPFTACAAFCSSFPVEKDSAFWGFSAFMCVMISILVLATFIDYLKDAMKNEHSPPPQPNLIMKMLLTFSLWTNAGVLLSVKEQKPGFIKCLDCIRFLSMLWVVTGHTFTFVIPPDTLLSMSHFTDHFWNHLLLNAFVSVDTFFLLSGIVVAYLFFKQKHKSSQIKSPLTWIIFYMHRYLRLTPPYMIFIGFYIVYGKYVQGPFSASQFNTLLSSIATCESYWWKNLFYINNMGDSSTACYAPSWYLAVDTQLYIFAPIILVGLYYSAIIGSSLIAVGMIGSLVTVYILYSIYDLPADFFGNGNTNLLYDMIYHKPWIRCPPYLIGLLIGYGLAVFGQRKIRIHWFLAVIGWLVAFGLGMACMFSTYDYDKGAYWSIFARATYYNFSRIAWSIAVSWVIVANHMGWGGPIDAFMSHPMWQPLGRLSYCAYIVHFFTLFWYLNINDSSMHFYSTFQVFIYYAVPACLLSYIFAFFWSSLFEIPILKLKKMMIEAILQRNQRSELTQVETLVQESNAGSEEQLIRL
ncbi:Nose resistant-to-fluoxetine protein N-terminal domain-containing protein [Caenorhabditis elegans]|uniref:Nose resistant-to-fluoxetine protein N-terminal domain-containing protein n=1 Tax=Caenorhabditis elegans TaxID=6239 RepID=O45283_CAEEL|nr:Nose resistant-to-fluoxetine protein N-terminal domain-containing protein [Caenorhabditis elegans]CAB05690.3 Nose resistant-to-fluoxetine protein N-terminal domain-containing protein [Caenorhabditis elegans]|eukprot:NP_507120.3 O-ACyltransferase homolog [Caenorhabditis elegans]